MFLFTYILVMTAISMEFLIIIGSLVDKIPVASVKVLAWQFTTNRLVAFLFNLIISCIISWFTGEGMTSGFANLMASIIISIIAPYVLDWKFKYNNFISTHRAHIEEMKNRPTTYKRTKEKIKTVFSRNPGTI